jgi:predicted metal-dependent hydrolase
MLRLFQRDATRAQEAAFIEVSHAGETYRIYLRRMAAARRFTLRVRTAARDVVLTMPARGSLSEAKSFAARHAAWIGAKLRRLPEHMRFEPGQSVPLRGVPHRIAHRTGLRGIVSVERPSPDVAAEPLLWVSGDPAFAPRRVQDFLIREARRDIEGAVARHAAQLGVKVRKITLRDTTSRWGSCSASGALNFSWRLIMAPHFVLDYLAAHEVAHLAHMNHSDAFWKVVGQLSPDVVAAEAWLKAHGSSLLRFGGGKSGGPSP